MVIVNKLVKDYTVYDKRENFKTKKNRTAPKQFRAVNSVSFTIEDGEMVGYIGPNGAGKSTTIKMLCGILTPTAGTIEINGIIPYKQRHENATQIGVIFGQKTQLWWDLPITSSLRLYQKMYGISEKEYQRRYSELRDMLELSEFEDRPVRTLSLGQRMRGELAAAVLHRPSLLILDEPTIGMDIVVKERIRLFLKDINQTYKTTVLLTTHDMTDIEKVCDRAIVINKGEKLFDGSLEDLRLKGMADSKVTLKLEEPIENDLMIQLRDLEMREDNTYSFSFNRASKENDILCEIINRHHVVDLFIADPTLEAAITKLL